MAKRHSTTSGGGGGGGSRPRSIVGAMIGEEEELDKQAKERQQGGAPAQGVGREAPHDDADSVVAEVDLPAPTDKSPIVQDHDHSPGEHSGGETVLCPKCGTSTSPLETNLPLPDSRNPDRDNPAMAKEGTVRQKRLERLMVRMTSEDREDWKLLSEAERLTESSLAYIAIREYMSKRRQLVESAKTFRSTLRQAG